MPETCNVASLKFLNQLSWFPHHSFGLGDFLPGGHSRNLATEGEKGKGLGRRKTLVRARYPGHWIAALINLLAWLRVWGLPHWVLTTDSLLGHLLIHCDPLLPQPKRNFGLLLFQLLIQNEIPCLAHYLLSGHFPTPLSLYGLEARLFRLPAGDLQRLCCTEWSTHRDCKKSCFQYAWTRFGHTQIYNYYHFCFPKIISWHLIIAESFCLLVLNSEPRDLQSIPVLCCMWWGSSKEWETCCWGACLPPFCETERAAFVVWSPKCASTYSFF